MDDSDELIKEGYGWKRVRVRCISTVKCGWQGKRVWGKKMFDKPCPKCKTKFKSGRTTVFCPPTMVT